MWYLLRLLRPHQWVKNSFVFAGVLFSQQWKDIPLVTHALLIACAFCLLCSAIYIVNDIFDRAIDSQHPIKKYRPIAAGQISINTAILLALILAIAGLTIGFSVSYTTGLILVIYAAFNLFYSIGLKNIIFCDVLIISFGFVLRILAGTLGLHIPPSLWLIVCTLTLTLFLGFNKRRVEQKILITSSCSLPKSLQIYPVQLLNIMIIICGLAAALSYVLYTCNQCHHLGMIGYKLLLTTPFVIYGISRYTYKSFRSKNNYGLDIAQDLMRDQQLLIIMFFWIIAVLWIEQ